MSTEPLMEYVEYRISRANEAYTDAELLLKEKRWNATVNRLYYSCFYAVLALLVKNGIKTRSHDGVRMQFGLKFVYPGIINKKYGKHFSKLFDLRQK